MIPKKEVLRIAKLARLEISEDEADRYSKDLSKILDHVAQLSKINLANVEPMTHLHDQTNLMREDHVEPSFSSKEALANAPDVSGPYIRVPLVVEHE